MPVLNTPFESVYGFKGPGFSVDSLGNIVANSIITAGVADEEESSGFVSFTVTDVDNDFIFAEKGSTANPTIEVARGEIYTFGLDVPDLAFQILEGTEESSLQYSTGLTHSDGATAAAAQLKTTGALRWAISSNAPDTLYYADELRNNFGTINVVDPIGQFSSVDINATTNAFSSTTGVLTVAGGASIEKNLFIGGELVQDGTGIPRLSSLTNLELNAANKIILQIEDIKLGEINSSGIAATINNSTVDNTVIGGITPSTAAFTAATVANLPTTDSGVSNKQYTDSTALALSIAFGL
mgnify:CR=1 FL=1